MTKREQNIKALEAMGSKLLPTNSKKYIVMSHPFRPDQMLKVYLGKAGAIRVGQTIESSFPRTLELLRILGPRLF